VWFASFSSLRYTVAMKPMITKEDALNYKKRWESVNEAEIQELRNVSVAQKFYQLVTLMACGKVFKVPSDTLYAEDEEVRKLWNLLRKACNVSR